MVSTQYDEKDIDAYENLQNEYRQLFTEYEKIKTDDSKKELLKETIEKIAEKNKEIKEFSYKLL